MHIFIVIALTLLISRVRAFFLCVHEIKFRKGRKLFFVKHNQSRVTAAEIRDHTGILDIGR